MNFFYCLGEYGPLVFIIVAFIIGIAEKRYFYLLITLAVALEWSVIGILWKFMLLPWGTVRPKYNGQLTSLKTTGLPSSHTASMIIATLFGFCVLGRWKDPSLITTAVVLLPLVLYQRIAYHYHSYYQVAVGVGVGILDFVFWLGVFFLIYTSKPQGKIIKCLFV